MSGVSRPRLSRRQLLKSGLALTVCAGTLQPGLTLADGLSRASSPPGDPDRTRWALLSDTHIASHPDDHHGSFYPYQNLREAIAEIATVPPDGVVITGDLARLKGEPQAYENFQALMAPISQCPIHLGLGNHDDREDFFQIFGRSGSGDRAVANKHVIVAETGPVQIIVLDSLLHVKSLTGELGAPQCAWLNMVLEARDNKPTILFLHHPPNGELLDTWRLLEIIKPQSKIKAVIYGHLHKYEYAQVAGIHLINLPATAYPILGNPPVGWVEAKLTPRGGEFTLHAIAGNRKSDGCTQTLLWRT